MASYTTVGGRIKVRVRKAGYPQETKTFKTNAAARAWARKVEFKMDSGAWLSAAEYADRHTSPDSERISAILKRFCSEIHALKPFGDSKMATSLAAMRRLEGLFIRDLDAAFWVNYARDRRGLGDDTDENYHPTPGLAGRVVGKKTINDELGYIKQAIDFAMTLWGLQLDYNPVEKALKVTATLGLTGASVNRTRRPTSAELRNVLENAVYFGAQRRLHCLSLYVRLAVSTAMRLSEIYNLKKTDIDFDREEFLVRDRKHPTAKKGNDFLVDMLPQMKRVMKSMPPTEGEYLISRHTVTSPDTISDRFNLLTSQLGILDLHFHDLRHEAISRFFEDTTLSAEEIMAISGHIDRSQIARYTQLRTRAQRRDNIDRPTLELF